MTDRETFTDNDYVNAITLALQEKDMPAVEALLTRLAVRNPHRAQEVIDMMRAGLTIARSRR